MSTDAEFWIYHEKQEAMLCGQHALNNLVQACAFSADSLAEIAYQLDQMELNYMSQNNEGGTNSKDYLNRVAEGSGNVDPSGNFSIEVLRAALKSKFGLDLPNIRQEGVSDMVTDVTEMDGFICNRQAHWFAIRKINGRFWNLNSMEIDRPTIISHFQLAEEIKRFQTSGYSVFCVPMDLPAPCSSKAQRQRGKPQFWWKEEDLVQGKTSAVTGATDPWKDVGSGMRLDGRSLSSAGASNQLGDMTEDEMLQMALAASLDPGTASAGNTMVPLTAEPSAGTEGAVRIQFRLPSGSRAVRRFLKSDPVKMLYSYVDEEGNDGQGRNLELRFGFPPKDLEAVCNKTVGDASLSGENIQCRWL